MELADLARRLQDLENGHRRLKGAAAGGLLGLLAFGALGQATGNAIPDEIEARHFLVKDAGGHVRGEFGLEPGGKGGHLVVYSSKGEALFETSEGLAEDKEDRAEIARGEEEEARIPGVDSLRVGEDKVELSKGERGLDQAFRLSRGPSTEALKRTALKVGDTFTLTDGVHISYTYTLTRIEGGLASFKVTSTVTPVGQEPMRGEFEVETPSYGLRHP
jgi:hypothetical protein